MRKRLLGVMCLLLTIIVTFAITGGHYEDLGQKGLASALHGLSVFFGVIFAIFIFGLGSYANEQEKSG